MSEVFHEWMIKRKNTPIGIMLRILVILLCVSSVFLFSVLGPIAFILGVLFAYGIRYIFQMTSVEYEYSYLSGECQIDKICGKMKRKGCGKIEMEKVDIVAPEESEALKEYEKKVYKLRDFSSREKDADRYVAFQRCDEGLIKVIFEPNDDIIREMQNVAPRKVIIKGQEKKY